MCVNVRGRTDSTQEKDYRRLFVGPALKLRDFKKSKNRIQFFGFTGV
jgi:hypothetical protein